MNPGTDASDLIHPLEALARRAEATSDEAVLTCGDRSMTAGEVLTGVDRIASALAACGVGLGDRVAIHMPNVPEAALALLACCRAGAIAVPLNTRYKTEELQASIGKTRPKLYLGHRSLSGEFKGVSEELIPVEARFVVDGDAEDARPWDELLAGAGDLGGRDLDPEGICVLLATSGTTGESKLVAWTNRLLSSLAPAEKARGMADGDVLPLFMPLMHGSGVSFMSATLSLDGHVVLIPAFDADEVLDAVERHGATAIVSLPFAFADLAKRQAERPRDLSSLRLCCAGGDVVPTEVAEAVEQHLGPALLSFWAATEEPGALGNGSKVGPLTTSMVTTEIRLVGKEGEEVVKGEPGEMLVRSPTTAAGYWDPEDGLQPLADGFFRSGDRLRWIGDDELEYVGRTKNLIVRAGSNISGAEVENALREQSRIDDVAVAGIEDPELGQRVGALFAIKGGGDKSAVADAIAAAKDHLADYKLPEVFAIAESIPRNSNGKVDYAAVEKAILDGKDSGPG